MKKLLLALILAVVLSLTLATPAFAGDPPENKPGNMPDGTNNMPPQGRAALVHADDAIFGLAMGGGWGPVGAHAIIRIILGGWSSGGQTFPPCTPGMWNVWVCPWT